MRLISSQSLHITVRVNRVTLLIRAGFGLEQSERALADHAIYTSRFDSHSAPFSPRREEVLHTYNGNIVSARGKFSLYCAEQSSDLIAVRGDRLI